MNARIALGIFFVVLISACDDPKEASEDNFKRAIQEYLDRTYPKCYVKTELPVVIDSNYFGAKEKLQALAKLGLVSESQVKIEKTTFGNKKNLVFAPSFELTKEGEKYFTPNVAKTMGGQVLGGFCIGKANVKDIGSFSEPSEMHGHRISRVNYTYEVSNLPEWATAPEITSVLKELKADVESHTVPIKKRDFLVLTNNGWVHEEIYRK